MKFFFDAQLALWLFEVVKSFVDCSLSTPVDRGFPPANVCEGLRTFHSSRSLTFFHMLNFKRMKILMWKMRKFHLDHQITIIDFRAYLASREILIESNTKESARKSAVCQRDAKCRAISNETSSSCNNNERKKKNGC